jgi:DNA-binding NarL/FixJ family response regulator
LHWADPSTRAALAFLVASLASARLLIVGTFRLEETVRDHPLAATLRHLDRNPRVARVDLRPFDVTEVEEQVTGILGAPPSKASLDAIFARSEGNALFAEELVAVGDPGVDLPGSVGEALIARSALLSDATRSVLRLASVAGRTTSYPVLAGASPLDEDRLADALREAVAANILEADHAGERYRFRHALLQESIYLDTLPGERRRLHASIARVLEASDLDPLRDPWLVTQLARHWFEAGDADRALTASAGAGDIAVAQVAHEEALSHFERVLELWDRAPVGRATLSHVGVLQRAAHSAYYAGQPRRTIEYGEQAIAELEGTDDRRLLVAVIDDLRLAAGHLGADDALGEYAGRLAAIDPAGLPVSEQSRILDGRITHAQLAGRFAEARAVTTELRALVEGEDDPRLVARAHLVLGWLLIDEVDVEGAAREAQLVVDLASRAGDVEAELEARNIAYEAFWTGRQHEATIVAAREFRAFAERAGLLRWEGSWASLAEADCLYWLGRLQECLEVVEAQLRDPPADRSLALLHLQGAQAMIAMGDFDDAVEHIRVALDLAEAEDEEIVVGYGPLMRARLANGQGRFEEVRAIVTETGPRLVSVIPQKNLAELTWTLVEVGLDAEATRADVAEAAGDRSAREAGRDVASQLVGHLESVRLAREQAGVRDQDRHDGDQAMIEGHLARLDGRDGPDPWRAAAEGYPAGSVEALYARYREAEAMLATKASRDAIADALMPVHAQAREIGARPIAARLESVARRARIDLRRVERPADVDAASADEDATAAPPDPGHAALRARGLSDREIEVLTLVAAGYSNPDIAERLFISSKTASVHVSHILDKLGVSTRTEAATIGVRLGLPEVDADGAW